MGKTKRKQNRYSRNKGEGIHSKNNYKNEKLQSFALFTFKNVGFSMFIFKIRAVKFFI